MYLYCPEEKLDRCPSVCVMADQVETFASFRLFLDKKTALNWYIVEVPIGSTFFSIVEEIIKSTANDDEGSCPFIVELLK